MPTLFTYLLQRFLQSVALLVGMASLVFFLSRLLPGDPTQAFLSPTIPPSVAERLRHEYGLTKPLAEQYIAWISAVSRGELGYSFSLNAPVGDILKNVFPNTLLLGLAALFFEIALALGAASLAVLLPGSRFDKAISHMAVAVYTLPTFWVGFLLLWVFSYSLGIFPSSQMTSLGMEGRNTIESLFDTASHVILPALTVAIPGGAGLLRYIRTSMVNVLSSDYVLAGRSMGLGSWQIFRHYVVPNSLGAATTYLGIEFGIVLAGVVVTETLFSWPGMGRLMVQATFARDYPLVLGCAILAGTVVIIGNLLADIVHAAIDPRVRLHGRMQ